jgi:hypothetical protein
MYKHFYLERVGEASEVPGPGEGCQVCSEQVDGSRSRGKGLVVIHGHREGYGRVVITGFRTDGYPVWVNNSVGLQWQRS